MDEIKKAEEEITKTIRKNIRLLMQRHGLVLSRFCEFLENSGEKSFHRSTFTRFMNGKRKVQSG